MLPILQIGPFAFQTPGLILLIGLWWGLNLSEGYARRRKQDVEAIGNLALYGLLAALVGARLGYALRFSSAFIENPGSLVSLNPGLLDPWGAALGSLLMALVYGQRKALRLWPTLDALTPLFAALGLAIPLSHLASGQGYGMPSEIPWAIELWGSLRHPSQIYEALAAAAILVYTIRLGRRERQITGGPFLEFAALSATARLFLEAFRGDSQLLPTSLRLAQVAAWLVLGLCLAVIAKRRTSPNP